MVPQDRQRSGRFVTKQWVMMTTVIPKRNTIWAIGICNYIDSNENSHAPALLHVPKFFFLRLLSYNAFVCFEGRGKPFQSWNYGSFSSELSASFIGFRTAGHILRSGGDRPFQSFSLRIE